MNVPFALIGGILALYVTGIHLTVSAALGLAVVVIGVLFSAAALTLIVLPALCVMFEQSHFHARTKVEAFELLQLT
jgi:Cu/Ag efflux pump CusA